jgi:hypothetical protein
MFIIIWQYIGGKSPACFNRHEKAIINNIRSRFPRRQKMASGVPYTYRPEDVTRLLKELPTIEAPPGKVEASFLKSMGFSNTSAKYLLNILKMLGFLDENDKASGVWLAYASDEKRGLILASAIKKAYSDLFESTLCPYLEDDEVLLDFFKRKVKTSPVEMERILQTFRNLVEPADFQDLLCEEGPDQPQPSADDNVPGLRVKVNPNLQINLQVHIDPDTSDEKIETIFKNMRKYLLGKDD